MRGPHRAPAILGRQDGGPPRHDARVGATSGRNRTQVHVTLVRGGCGPRQRSRGIVDGRSRSGVRVGRADRARLHDPVDIGRHRLPLDDEGPHGLGQRGVLGQQPREEFGLRGNAVLALQGQFGEVFTVFRIGDRIHLVAFGLPRLGKQDQRGGIPMKKSEQPPQRS